MAPLHSVWFIPIVAIIICVAFKRKKITVIKSSLFIVIAIISFVIFIFLNIWRADRAIQQFECEYANIHHGMTKNDVMKIMGRYVISDKHRRVMFRSLPQKKKTYFRLKDAFVDIDYNEEVVNKSAVYVPD
jgi:uncharacterized membrane protein